MRKFHHILQFVDVNNIVSKVFNIFRDGDPMNSDSVSDTD